jgi:GTPase involved in cell partitioning and DNA repair
LKASSLVWFSYMNIFFTRDTYTYARNATQKSGLRHITPAEYLDHLVEVENFTTRMIAHKAYKLTQEKAAMVKLAQRAASLVENIIAHNQAEKKVIDKLKA